MYTIITERNDGSVGAYQLYTEESAKYVARTTAEHEEVKRTGVYVSNPADPNGIGQMRKIAEYPTPTENSSLNENDLDGRPGS